MKTMPVLTRIIIIFAGLVIVMFTLLNTVGLRLMQKELVKTEKQKMYGESTTIINQYLVEYYKKDMNFFDLVSRLEIAAEMTETRIWVIANNGMIVSDSAGLAQQGSVYEAYPNFLDYTSIASMPVSRAIPAPVLVVTQPIIVDYQQRGYLSIMVPMEMIYSRGVYYSDFVNICYLIFLPVLLLAFAFIYLSTIRPIKGLSKATKEYSAKNFAGKFELNYPRELAELGGTIQYMGDRLAGNSETQRKFLSNVSHDFRSPLTSIRGYIEAFRDGAIPEGSEEKYYEILLYETDRLTNLTSNLLQLNNIDDNGLILNKCYFDINEMIRHIALSFEGTLSKKKIILKLQFSAKDTVVEADQSRIQQVIYNLLDNAIKFSSADSVIKLSTEEKGSKVLVSVKDHGTGIPKDSIIKIWDRFYKADQSRGRDKKGSGLGLSIVKEIIDAHGENISVASTEGVGTEFVFSLPLAE